jgi:hypothetical protein
MKMRPLIAVVLAFWFVIGPVGTALAAYVATPCDSMSGMNQPLPPADDCCGESMDLAACLSACASTAPTAVAPALHILAAEPVTTAIPGGPLRYATVLAPPDIAPPKSSVS